MRSSPPHGRAQGATHDVNDSHSRNALGARPAEFLYRQGRAAAESRSVDAGARALSSATWNCRGCAASRCICARPMPMRRLSASTRQRQAQMPPGVDRCGDRPGALPPSSTPRVGVLSRLKGPQIRAAERDRDQRSGVLAGRSLSQPLVATSRAVAEDAAELGTPSTMKNWRR